MTPTNTPTKPYTIELALTMLLVTTKTYTFTRD